MTDPLTEHRASRSPLLDLPGAVAAEGVDASVAAHYGSFHAEQRTLEAGDGFVDLPGVMSRKKQLAPRLLNIF